MDQEDFQEENKEPRVVLERMEESDASGSGSEKGFSKSFL